MDIIRKHSKVLSAMATVAVADHLAYPEMPDYLSVKMEMLSRGMSEDEVCSLLARAIAEGVVNLGRKDVGIC